MKNYLLLFVLIFTVSLQSCGKKIISNSAEKKISKGQYALLSEINNPETILLVQLNGDNIYNKYIRKHMMNEYSHKYDFLTVKNAYQHYTAYPRVGYNFKIFDEPKFVGKFEDSTKYRFFIGQYYVTRKVTKVSDGSNQESTVFDCHYYILDRQTNRKLELPKSSISYSPLFQGYIKGIEVL